MGLVVLFGVAAGVVAYWVPSTGLGDLAWLMALLALATSTRIVTIPRTYFSLNVDTPFLMALLFMGATREMVLISGINAIVLTLYTQSARREGLWAFNGAAGLLGGLAAAALWWATSSLLIFPLPELAAGVALFATQSVVVAGAILTASGKWPARGWWEGLKTTGLGHIASASLGAILAMPNGAMFALLSSPLFLVVWRAYRAHQGQEHEKVERLREREELFVPTLEALVAAIEARDPSTHGHNRRVQSYALGLAQAAGYQDDQLEVAIRYGALLHDVGKIAIPDSLLHAKRQFRPEELERVRKHAELGADLIRHVPIGEDVVKVVRHHHERWDGGGYPDGLAGKEIPLAARIVAVADVYDYLRTGGGWQAPIAHEEVLDILAKDDGGLDPDLLEAFLRWQRSAPGTEEERVRWSAANDAIRASSEEQAQLYAMAFRDELTGLRNGRAMRQDMAEICENDRSVGVLMMDLDGFKGVNDHFGHDLGDEALRLVGKALLELEEGGRMAYRNGGDEFIVVIPDATEDTLPAHAEAIRERVEQDKMMLNEIEYIPVKCSVGGIARKGLTVDELLKAADTAMYEVKKERKKGQVRGAKPQVFRLDEVAAG